MVNLRIVVAEICDWFSPPLSAAERDPAYTEKKLRWDRCGYFSFNRSMMDLGFTDSPTRLMYGMLGVVIALVEVLLPFMILALDAALINIPPSLYEAARNLGAGRVRIFVSVTLPLALPGMLSGSVLVFTLSVSAFVTPSLIGGPRVPVMSTLIYQQGMSLLNWPFGAAIGFTMLATILALFMLTSGFATQDRGA